jgi:hypothetical protein
MKYFILTDLVIYLIYNYIFHFKISRSTSHTNVLLKIIYLIPFIEEFYMSLGVFWTSLSTKTILYLSDIIFKISINKVLFIL